MAVASSPLDLRPLLKNNGRINPYFRIIMANKTKKALILAFLQSQSQAISLRNIQAHSGVDFVAERTLRRWLSEWVGQGIVSKIGEKRSTRYIHKGTAPLFLSKIPAHKRESILKQLRDLWTHNSNAIEGNTLSLGDTHFILEEGLTISGKPLREHQEVIGHARAIDILYNSLSEPLSKKLLFELHKALQTETATDIYKPYGAWKLEPNGSYVVTREDKQVYIEYARPIDIEKLMSELTQAVNTLPRLSIEQAAIHYAHIHAAFVHIHPFSDGNGRIARLIANIPLLKSGLPPLIIDIKNRQEYIQILAEYEMTTGQLNTNRGIWPDKDLLKEFEAFCTAQ